MLGYSKVSGYYRVFFLDDTTKNYNRPSQLHSISLTQNN
jgi:hypothetical protein